MASACSLDGTVSIKNVTPYTLESKMRFWKMNGFTAFMPGLHRSPKRVQTTVCT
ncbi:hypothetical protein BDR04DRAFT_1108622 [Suillus decipiens]|nr:hypothetical protein BDR04DRAFT_1108622 [Suillus decipiens]